MNRPVVINTAVAALIVALVVAVFVVEGRDSETAATTTSTSTTTVPATTTTSTTTTTTTTSTTSTTSTTTSSTVPPTTEVPLPRGLWKVIVVNGSTSGERLDPTVERLKEIGYVNVRGLVGAVQTTETVIYFLLPGQDSAADRLRADLELFDASIAGFGEAPPVAGRNDAQLMVYLGGS